MSGRESMAEPPDINVDELRRRARRRLIGAVVLALAVAVIVPMLLETEEKPLGEDVSVKIPPIDDSKFVNRLSENREKDSAKSATKTPAKDEPVAGRASSDTERTGKYDTRVPDATPAAQAPSPTAATDASKSSTPNVSDTKQSPPSTNASSAGMTPPSATSTTSTPESSTTVGTPAQGAASITDLGASTPTSNSSTQSAPSQASSPKSVNASKAGTDVERAKAGSPDKSSHPETKLATAAPSSTTRPPTSETKADAHEGFAVQLAAFADDKGANALVGRLKRSGYTAYTEPLKTSKGTLWRVRVGPYPSREAAVAARDRLKSEGQSGIVAAVK